MVYEGSVVVVWCEESLLGLRKLDTVLKTYRESQEGDLAGAFPPGRTRDYHVPSDAGEAISAL